MRRQQLPRFFIPAKRSHTAFPPSRTFVYDLYELKIDGFRHWHT